jgi:CRISPR/Cas system-associated exonuclease Cas4 (RecB family)
MVAIPAFTCPTIDKVKQAAVYNQKRERRDYLGASLIGHPCARHIWYEYKGFPRDPFEAATLWNFEDGHRTEALVIERLKATDGLEVWDVDAAGKQFGFTALDGKFKGHMDGVVRGLVQAPKTPHVLEVKACGQKKYDEFAKLRQEWGDKATLERWNEGYYAQAQIYMHYFKLDRHYLVCALAGGRDMQACRTEYNPEYAARLIDKAEAILQSLGEPARVSDKSDYFICRWCPFAEVCHGG